MAENYRLVATRRSLLWIPLLMLVSAISSAETRGYVISMLHTATHEDPRNCPNGGNPDNGETRIKIYRSLGYSEEKIAEMHNGKLGLSELYRIAHFRGRKGDQFVDVHSYPTAVPDQNLELVTGPLAYGFDLDGKGADQASGFVDPETGERGVDNQLFRVLGCFVPYRVKLPIRPYYEEHMWTSLISERRKSGAWLITLTGEDLSQDGVAVLEFHKAINSLRKNDTGDTLTDATYRIDPNPRSHGKLRGIIKEGMFVSNTNDAAILLEGELPNLAQLELYRSRIRLNLNADRTVSGYLGGYLTWRDFWFMSNSVGEDSNVDTSALYYMLQRLADARPAPKTGENTSISSTFRIEAAPAFIIRSDGRYASNAHQYQ